MKCITRNIEKKIAYISNQYAAYFKCVFFFDIYAYKLVMQNNNELKL